MSWNGNFFFGYNSDGYVEYTDGSVVTVASSVTSDAASTLKLLANTGRDSAKKLVDEGWDMPYDWTWGDIIGEVPDEVFAAAGLSVKVESVASVINNDEIVMNQMTSEPGTFC